MKIVFLSQGLKDCKESVGSVLLESLSDTAFNEFKCISAFASLKGIIGISDAIENAKRHIKRFDVVVGIDQNGTSKEALEALLSLNIGASVYYTRSPIIFHPKVYMFEGEEKARLIVGSSNITLKGLFQNVEASLRVDFTKPDEEGEELFKQVKSYLEPFFDGTKGNLQKLTHELIRQLYNDGIIPNHAEKQEARMQSTKKQRERQEEGKIETVDLFPKVELQPLPEGVKIEPKVKAIPIQKPTLVSGKPIVLVPIDPWTLKGNLLWSKVLKPSDVLQAKSGTNPTGCLRLTQAGYPIDQTTHFRKNIFGKLAWIVGRTTPFVEIAKVTCYVKILGIDKGLQTFMLRHKPSGEAGQGNYTTSLSWGGFGVDIIKTNLTDKTLNLYAPQKGQDEPFYIEIDGQSKVADNLGKWFG
jgi:HKD family nuclease